MHTSTSRKNNKQLDQIQNIPKESTAEQAIIISKKEFLICEIVIFIV